MLASALCDLGHLERVLVCRGKARAWPGPIQIDSWTVVLPVDPARRRSGRRNFPVLCGLSRKPGPP